MSSAWLTFSTLDMNESVNNMNGWLNRLRPMLDKSKFNKNFGFVFTNRCGKEFDTQYIGSTLHVQLNPLEKVKYLGFDNEDVLISTFVLK